MIPTHHPKISIAQVADNDFETINTKIDKILGSLNKMSETMVIEEMQEIVPGYKSKFELIIKADMWLVKVMIIILRTNILIQLKTSIIFFPFVSLKSISKA